MRRNRPKERELTPEQLLRVRARQLANVHQARGKLKPQPCEVCGTTVKVEKHHEDYSRPLDIRWLCRRCHLQEHENEHKRAS
jgi:ribosomal protein S27AE